MLRVRQIGIVVSASPEGDPSYDVAHPRIGFVPRARENAGGRRLVTMGHAPDRERRIFSMNTKAS